MRFTAHGIFLRGVNRGDQKGHLDLRRPRITGKACTQGALRALTAQINKLSTKMAVPLVFFLIAVLVLILPPLIIPTASMLMEIM